MRSLVAITALLLCATLAGCAGDKTDDRLPDPLPAGSDGIVVVAVIDTQFDPYTFDFLASQMPQHLDDDASNDLPLDTDPATWVPGFPAADSFASYGPLQLKLSQDETADPNALHTADQAAWNAMPVSGFDNVEMRYIPGTKVIGFVDFDGAPWSTSSHGTGTTSVSVGNLHGSCPECLLVFVNGMSDEAVSWVAKQDWIDVQTNSWGFSKLATEKMWTDCDLETQRAGVERGQQIFFSGGNGMANAFDAPVLTLYSCQKGADWVVAVGANTPEGATYSGSGKPADMAAIGSGYPSGYGHTNLVDGGEFGGTSNATPVTAGTYARALWLLRHQAASAPRMQAGGVLLEGPAGCGGVNAECAMADGQLTVHELRQAMFDSVEHTQVGIAVATDQATIPFAPGEIDFLDQGHGSLMGRMGDYAAESQRIADLAAGNIVPSGRDQIDLFAQAVSYCSQAVWGAWDFGAWNAEMPVPAADPVWPARAWFSTACAPTITAIVTVADALP